MSEKNRGFLPERGRSVVQEREKGGRRKKKRILRCALLWLGSAREVGSRGEGEPVNGDVQINTQ